MLLPSPMAARSGRSRYILANSETTSIPTTTATHWSYDHEVDFTGHNVFMGLEGCFLLTTRWNSGWTCSAGSCPATPKMIHRYRESCRSTCRWSSRIVHSMLTSSWSTTPMHCGNTSPISPYYSGQEDSSLLRRFDQGQDRDDPVYVLQLRATLSHGHSQSGKGAEGTAEASAAQRGQHDLDHGRSGP